MTDDTELEVINSDDELVEVSDNEGESEPSSPWDIPAFPTTSREELASLTKEELVERLKKMQMNVSIARRTLKSDESGLSQAVFHLMKKNKEFSVLEEERDRSYWGGKNAAPPTLPPVLDPRMHSAYAKIFEKLDERTKKYDILYEQLKEALPKETLPTPFCGKSSVLERLKVLEETLSSMAATNDKMEHRQQGGATHRAAVRLRELNRQLVEVKHRKKKEEAALWKDNYNIKYWDLCGRIELCEKRLAELRKEFPDQEEVSEAEGLDMDDLEEVDDTEEPEEQRMAAEVIEYDEHLDYDVSDSEINA